MMIKMIKTMNPKKTSKLYLNSNFFSFALGLCIILLILWNRLIRQRLPKTLLDFNHLYIKIIIYATIIYLIISLTITFYQLLFNQKQKKPGRILEYIFKQPLVFSILNIVRNAQEKISESPKIVYKLFYNMYNVSHILEKPFYKISHFIKNLPKIYVFILPMIHIIFYTLPKLIPAIIFIIEIFFFEKLDLFYKSLFLYFIWIIYLILLWILSDLADNNTYFATAHINIEYHKKNHFTATFQKQIPNIEDAIDIISKKHDRALLEWFVYIYKTYLEIKWLVYRLDKEKTKFKRYETSAICLLYLIGWVFVLYKIGGI